jgi:glycosyltransferase involved in cell wall biosynthesis
MRASMSTATKRKPKKALALPRTLNIGAVPHSFDGSSYYRIWLPFKHLGENGDHITGVARPGGPMVTPQEAEALEVLVFQRPAGREGARMLESLAGRCKLVYEVDDDMLNVESHGLPHLDNDQLRASVKRCLRLCDMVTVTNEHLAEIVRPFNDNIRILPNHVKRGLIDHVRPQRDKVTIGWAGGTTHLGDLYEIATPLTNVLAGNPDVDMHFIGADFAPLVGYRSRWTPWKSDVGDYYKGIDFDIAIAPSEDTVFNRSKTWIRALEMGALGIPIVAQNRLPYSDYVIDGKTGFLVDTADEWEAALNTLINDADLRAEMGAAAREQAAGWTIEEGWRLWQSAYEHAANG